MKELTRRGFLRNGAALTTASLLKPGFSKAQSSTRKSGKRPNILIFMPDQQQGATVLPEHPCLTPNVDRMAREGVMFTQAYCPSPHCCPSRVSFQTGLYPSEHGVFNNVDTDTAIHTNPYPGHAHNGAIRVAFYRPSHCREDRFGVCGLLLSC